MRRESREGTEDFSPDFERFPVDDIRLETVDRESWEDEISGLGLGDSECMTMRTGM